MILILRLTDLNEWQVVLVYSTLLAMTNTPSLQADEQGDQVDDDGEDHVHDKVNVGDDHLGDVDVNANDKHDDDVDALQIAQMSYCWAIIDEIMQTLSYFQQMWVMYVRKLLKRGPRTRRGRRNRRCQQQIMVDDGSDEDHDKTNHKEKKAMMMLLLLPFPNCCDREELASQIAGELLRFDGFLKTGIGLKY